ncbi:prophage protein [Mycobacterium tuberculosis]|nr:prophage protein [Mycobacterium tuberculosis]
MMADAVKYVVMCNCDDEPGALIIAWIDDERPAGGHIQMRSNTRFTETQWGRRISSGHRPHGPPDDRRRPPTRIPLRHPPRPSAPR